MSGSMRSASEQAYLNHAINYATDLLEGMRVPTSLNKEERVERSKEIAKFVKDAIADGCEIGAFVGDISVATTWANTAKMLTAKDLSTFRRHSKTNARKQRSIDFYLSIDRKPMLVPCPVKDAVCRIIAFDWTWFDIKQLEHRGHVLPAAEPRIVHCKPASFELLTVIDKMFPVRLQMLMEHFTNKQNDIGK